MQENFLHYIWKYKKFNTPKLKTTTGEVVTLVKAGQHNRHSGPDFFDARMRIGGQLWAGNVEIHVKSSDWYLHSHENDPAYDNVILHVVYEDDVEVFRKDNTAIPALELKSFIDPSVLQGYQNLLHGKPKWIHCENEFADTDDFLLRNWTERLYFERLEQKAQLIAEMLKSSKNDWEAVLFRLLAKNFGLKVNGDAFLSMASSFDFPIVRKLQTDVLQLEALFLGQSGILDQPIEDPHYQMLAKAYFFLKQKFGISNFQVVKPQFFRLRPPNFPTIRLAQLAMLYHREQGLFSKVIGESSIEGFYSIFSIAPTAFWQNHYTFGKTSARTKKALTHSFIDLLAINTLLPLKFCYAKHLGQDIDEEILNIVKKIVPEKNAIVDTFFSLKKGIKMSAMESQALIQLKTVYCNKSRCLDCAIGNALLNA